MNPHEERLEEVLAASGSDDLQKLMERLNAAVNDIPKPTSPDQIESYAEKISAAMVALSEDPEMQTLMGSRMVEEAFSYIFKPEGRTEAAVHPEVSGYIKERLQFDGDIPELRLGPLDVDLTPAVPVDTTVLNPVKIGAMLKKASDDVYEEFKGLVDQATEQFALHAEEHGEDDAVRHFLQKMTPETTDLVPTGRPDLDPEGYESGKIPALRKVEEPDIQDLTRRERQEYSWKTISTTQGRRSAARALEHHLAACAERMGIPACPAPPSVDGVLREKEWRYYMSGCRDLNPSFNYLESAFQCFVNTLQEVEGGFRFCVEPVDDIPSRQVGWRLLVFR